MVLFFLFLRLMFAGIHTNTWQGCTQTKLGSGPIITFSSSPHPFYHHQHCKWAHQHHLFRSLNTDPTSQICVQIDVFTPPYFPHVIENWFIIFFNQTLYMHPLLFLYYGKKKPWVTFFFDKEGLSLYII